MVILQEQNLVVAGDVIEEVMNGHAAGVVDKIKTGVIHTVPPFAGIGGILFLLSVLRVI